MQGHEQVGGALFSLDIQTGEAELLLDNWNGLRFNSPNDLVVRAIPIISSLVHCARAECPALKVGRPAMLMSSAWAPLCSLRLLRRVERT